MVADLGQRVSYICVRSAREVGFDSIWTFQGYFGVRHAAHHKN